MKEAATSIARNTTAMMGSQIVTWAASFVLMTFLPRYLGAEEFGKLYFAGSIVGLMGAMYGLGIGEYFVKEVARDRSKVTNFFANAAALRVIAWMISFLVAIAYVHSAVDSSDTLVLVILVGCGAILGGLADLGYRVFQAFECMQYRSAAVIVQQVSSAAICVVLLLLGFKATAIAAAGILTSALAFGIVLLVLPRVVHLDWSINTSSWPGLLRGSFPFLVATGLSFVYYRIDVMMLSAMTNDTVVGWYGAPYRLFDTLGFFPSIVGTAVYPVMARLWQDSKEGLAWTAQKILNITIVIAIPLAVILASCARPIISLLFGLAHFSNSVILLQILAASLPVLYIDFVFGNLLASADRQRYAPLVAAVALAINIPLNYFLIPYFQQTYGNGAIGAAITTFLTEVVVSGLFFSLLPRGYFTNANLRLAMKSLVAGSSMALSIWLMEPWMQYWYVVAPLGAGVYVGVVSLLKAFSRKEIGFLLNLIPLRRFAAETADANSKFESLP
ncbi:MAG TPA: hypothetical protein DGH68_00880 [Bacteroidetes bacterium]|nr:hypothetical protein [Bacteroidota bacterium]